MFEETGCAGVSIGRGAFYDPWIFRRTLDYLTIAAGGTESAPSLKDSGKPTVNVSRLTSPAPNETIATCCRNPPSPNACA